MLVLVIGDLHLPHRASDLPSKFRKLLVPGKIQQIICTGNVCDRETLDYLRTIAGDVHVVRGDWDENPYFANSLVLHHAPLRIGVLHGHQIVPPGDGDSQCALARAMDVDILITGHTHRFDAFERDGRFFVNPGSATGAWSSVWPIAADEAELEGEEEAADKGAAKEGEEAIEDAAAKAQEKSNAPAEDKKENGEAAAKKDDAKEEGGEANDDSKEKEEKPTDDAPTEEDTKTAKKEPAPPTAPKAASDPIPSFALLDIQGPAVVTYVYQLIDGEVKVEKIEFRKKLETGGPGAPGYIASQTANPAAATAGRRGTATGVRY